jgi:beta-glucosidase
VRNSGLVAGSEVLQLYISAPNSPTQRPVKELHGFEKVFLRPGEERLVRIPIDKYATSYWDESESKWCSEAGVYKVIIASSSAEGAQKVETDLKVETTSWWLGL